MQPEILPSHKIDKQKWDECIKRSSSSLVYATSVYLDHMADNWDGIIAEDYKFVMPVAWRKKFGIKYCYDVPFVQQLGVFGTNVQEEDIDVFKSLLQKLCKYGDYPFNYTNITASNFLHNNYILMLSSKYEVLKQFYSSNLLNNLSKTNKQQLQYEPGEMNEAIELFKNLYAKRFPHVSAGDYKNFTSLCELKAQANNLIVRKVGNGDETLAIVLLLKDERRMYNLMPSTTENGKKMSAGHFLLDCLIKEFSHTGMILDFEGSDIPGIENFYKSFGAVNQPYFKLHVNRLPVLLRVFKR